MKKNMLRLGATLGLLPLAGPASAQQTWEWATAPTGITGPCGVADPYGSPIGATALDGAGNIVVMGQFYGTFTLGTTTLTSAGYNDIFVAKLSPTGQWLQAVRAGGPGQDYPTALAPDAAGNAVIAGNFGNLVPGASAAFGPITLTTAGGSDAFVAQLSPSG